MSVRPSTNVIDMPWDDLPDERRVRTVDTAWCGRLGADSISRILGISEEKVRTLIGRPINAS